MITVNRMVDIFLKDRFKIWKNSFSFIKIFIPSNIVVHKNSFTKVNF